MARRNNGNDKILNSAALENILIGAYDAFVEENVEIRAEAGLTETITRESIGGCCEWCSKLAGTYRYGEEPKEVYQKHDNCTCVVTAKTDKGYTDVWSKKQYQSQKAAREAREEVFLRENKLQKTYKRKFIEAFSKGIEQKTANDIMKSKNKVLIRAGIFVDSKDKLSEYAKEIKPIKGYSDFVCHASDESFHIYDGDYKLDFSARDFAELIKLSKDFKNEPIRLISCRAGAEKEGLAQQLADLLGVDVMAATEDVNVDESGRMFVSDNDILADMWHEAPKEEKEKILETGKWIVLHPRKRK